MFKNEKETLSHYYNDYPEVMSSRSKKITNGSSNSNIK